jgi:probable HAF family extracellular repeat protein
MNKMKRTLLAWALLNSMLTANWLAAQQASSAVVKHHAYAVVVLPPDGGADSFLAGYLFYAPLTANGALGLAADTSTGGVLNSYIWTDGRQTDLQPLPQHPNLSGTSTYINWINGWGLAAGYGTRTDSSTGHSYDHAALWLPNGQIIPLRTPVGAASRAVWVNGLGQVSGWIAPGAIADPCSFGDFGPVGLQSMAVRWEFGFARPLGTLGGVNSYGEFINDRGQVSGHSQTGNVANSNTGCPPFDPFIWQDGKMTDIVPGDFGGAEGGTNFLNNRGQAVGFADLYGDVDFHAFLWSAGQVTDLSETGSLGANQDSAFNVSERGHVVGISITASGTLLAVLWQDGQFTNLMSLGAEGDDCSEPFRINSRDQIVGVSFSCETGAEHAFLFEHGEMVDLNSLIPADSGLEIQSANWIDEDGVIAAQAIVTSGSAMGASRAVLLYPTGESRDGVQSAAVSTPAAPAAAAAARARSGAFLRGPDGRVNPMLRRPFDPQKLLGRTKG